MFDKDSIQHHIQHHIMGALMHKQYARFRDMRPPTIDTNLYSYHLLSLQKRGFVVKDERGYRLAKKGLIYIDRVSTKSLRVRTQPKIVTMLVVQNSNGCVLLYHRRRQPFTDLWTLPYGKVHIDDTSLEASARREMKEKLSITTITPRRVGDCYIRIYDSSDIIMSTLVHIFRVDTDEIREGDQLQWVKPHKLHEYELAPAVEQIIARTFFNDPYFFEEYTEPIEKWYNVNQDDKGDV